MSDPSFGAKTSSADVTQFDALVRGADMQLLGVVVHGAVLLLKRQTL
jgi:hypothetical protein